MANLMHCLLPEIAASEIMHILDGEISHIIWTRSRIEPMPEWETPPDVEVPYTMDALVDRVRANQRARAERARARAKTALKPVNPCPITSMTKLTPDMVLGNVRVRVFRNGERPACFAHRQALFEAVRAVWSPVPATPRGSWCGVGGDLGGLDSEGSEAVSRLRGGVRRGLREDVEELGEGLVELCDVDG